MLQNSMLLLKTYIKSKLLKENIVDLSQQTFVMPEWFTYNIIEVSKDQVARPDLVSMNVYNTDIYGDVICKINNISNPFEINEGDRLIIPTIDTLDSFYTNDPYIDEDNPTQRPVKKNKKDKRKANESVVGDVRFKIDSSNKVIIY